jgi:hypothetical protein
VLRSLVLDSGGLLLTEIEMKSSSRKHLLKLRKPRSAGMRVVGILTAKGNYRDFSQVEGAEGDIWRMPTEKESQRGCPAG